MIFCGAEKVENIYFCSDKEPGTIYYIDIIINQYEPFLYVMIGAENDDTTWTSQFYYNGNSAYERIKMCIYSALIASKTINELFDTMNSFCKYELNDLVFNDDFNNILLN